MNAHLRANFWLFGLTLLLCCVLYPLVLWGLGRTAFRHQAEGSLVTGPDGKVMGSRLIAQPFSGPEYFQPRPSAASYNAAASGGSNYGASNPRLRARVAQALGPIVKYRSGPKKDQLVGPDIEKWFQEDRFQGKPHLVEQWARAYPFVAQDWVKADKLNSDHVQAWQNAHAQEVELWKNASPDAEGPRPEDLAEAFFVSFSHTFPGSWPGVVDRKLPDGTTVKRIEPVAEDESIQRNFFDMWLQDHPDVELVAVPADMVMTSGSGLDPHITLENARYQLDRVASAWAEKTRQDRRHVREAIEAIVSEMAQPILGGLDGMRLINVLEVNLALPTAMKRLAKAPAPTGGAS